MRQYIARLFRRRRSTPADELATIRTRYGAAAAAIAAELQRLAPKDTMQTLTTITTIKAAIRANLVHHGPTVYATIAGWTMPARIVDARSTPAGAIEVKTGSGRWFIASNVWSE